MLKKAIVGVLVGGLSIGLVAGAINRTVDKTNQVAATAVAGGRNQRQISSDIDTGTLAGGRGNGNSTNPVSGGTSENGKRYGNRTGSGNDASPANSNQRNDELLPAEEVYSIEGTVLSGDETSLVLLMSDGEQIVLDGRTWTYAIEAGFATAAGHSIQLQGFDEDGEFKVLSMLDHDTLAAITLREENGRPLWAGKGGRNA